LLAARWFVAIRRTVDRAGGGRAADEKAARGNLAAQKLARSALQQKPVFSGAGPCPTPAALRRR